MSHVRPAECNFGGRSRVSTITADRSWTVKEQRILAAANARHGLVPAPQRIQISRSDIASVIHVGVPAAGGGTVRSPSGGVGRTVRAATMAAVCEALERYAAVMARPPRRRREQIGVSLLAAEDFSLFSAEQRADEGFVGEALYGNDVDYVAATEHNGALTWVPAPLVLLQDLSGAQVSTSNGLAAGPSPVAATLRATQELIERDAFMSTWLHGVPARQVTMNDEHQSAFRDLGGEVTCFDFTPAYSPHPVAAVAAMLPSRGAPRYSLGLACRARWEDAVEKAWLECVQGLMFAGWYCKQPFAERVSEPKAVTTFDQHAAFYTWNPQLWAELPLFGGGLTAAPASAPEQTNRRQELAALLQALETGGIRVLHAPLNTVELAPLGVHVVRALSPDLTPLHCHESRQFLGGTTPDVRRRYPWVDLSSLTFPNVMPHPLG